MPTIGASSITFAMWPRRGPAARGQVLHWSKNSERAGMRFGSFPLPAGERGGARSEPGEGALCDSIEAPSAPHPVPLPRRSGLPDLRMIDAEIGQARFRWGEGAQE